LLLATLLGAIPYGIAFLLVTGVAWGMGKMPARGSRLWLLPWLEFLCGCLTLVVSVGLLHLVHLQESVRIAIACAVWLIFYGQRTHSVAEFCQALIGLLAGLGLLMVHGAGVSDALH
jgi:hypothetical protein